MHNHDRFDKADAAARVGRSADEDAASDDDLADADHAHVPVLLFGAKRIGPVLDGEQRRWSSHSIVDQSTHR